MNLSKLTDSCGIIRIAAFDHRDSLAKYVPQEKFGEFKNLLTIIFKDYVTGVLVDPIYGEKSIETANRNGTSLILSREESGYTDNPEGRETVLTNIDSRQLKQMGASAIKMLLYYNPDSSSKQKQLYILKQVSDEAHAIELPLVLEPITYPLTNVDYNKAREIKRTLQEISQFADILKIEYPTDPENEPLEIAEPHLKEITQMLKEKPWILLSRGSMTFETFKSAVSLCLRNGAKGYAVGRAVWQEVKDYQTWEEKENFIRTVGKVRMQELSQLKE